MIKLSITNSPAPAPAPSLLDGTEAMPGIFGSCGASHDISRLAPLECGKLCGIGESLTMGDCSSGQ